MEITPLLILGLIVLLVVYLVFLLSSKEPPPSQIEIPSPAVFGASKKKVSASDILNPPKKKTFVPSRHPIGDWIPPERY